MKIRREVIEKAVKNACNEGRQWSKIKYGFTYSIMLDTADGDIWCDTFIDCNSWKEYHSETIHRLTVIGLTVKEVECNCVEEAIETLKKAGWKIEG